MKYTKEKLEKIVSESNNYSEVVRKFGLIPYYGNRQTVKKYIEIFDIKTEHFRMDYIKTKNKKIDLNNILIENSKYDRKNLKERLYKEGLKERKCELCEQGEEWNGKHMSLILDHINGINNDNRLENLRIVCPNCNATLDTHGGKNIKIKYNHLNKDGQINILGEKNYCDCGKEIHIKSKKCLKCEGLKQRKTERPPYEQLLNEIKKLGYRGTGRKYNVSDSSIRKWVKYYIKNI